MKESILHLRTFIPLIASLLSLSLLVPAGSCWAGHLGTFTSKADGFDTHTYYYDDGQEVTVIDTQFIPRLTQEMVDRVHKETRSPITRVIVTHPNPDKFNGLSVLHALGAESLASKATADALKGVHDYKKHFFVDIAKMFSEADYPRFEPIRSTFSGRMVLRLKSGESLTLFELKNPGISSNQTVVRIDATGDLVVGDLTHYRAHAWLEGGIVGGVARPDLSKWRAALLELDALTKNPQALVYGGRGEVGKVADVVDFQRSYLARADALVSTYVAKANKSELRDPTAAQSHYAKLQKLFEQEFPDLGHSYLVGYGVYGLVNSKLK